MFKFVVFKLSFLKKQADKGNCSSWLSEVISSSNQRQVISTLMEKV